MEKKKPNEMKQPLKDEVLRQASGGSCRSASEDDKPIRWDAKGNPTHWQEYVPESDAYEPYHYRCPHCGRLLHEGALGRLYCDPCDEGWFRINLPWGCRYEDLYPGC